MFDGSKERHDVGVIELHPYINHVMQALIQFFQMPLRHYSKKEFKGNSLVSFLRFQIVYYG